MNPNAHPTFILSDAHADPHSPPPPPPPRISRYMDACDELMKTHYYDSATLEGIENGEIEAAAAVPEPMHATLLSERETAQWFDVWNQRMMQWWLLTPYKEGLNACAAALGLFLADKLEWAYRMFTIQPLASPPPRHGVGSEECDWITHADVDGRLNLPDFPEFPAQFKLPPVVPLPRLLVPTVEWLQSRGLEGAAAGVVSLRNGGGGGAVAGAGVSLAGLAGAQPQPDEAQQHARQSDAHATADARGLSGSARVSVAVAAGLAIGAAVAFLFVALVRKSASSSQRAGIPTSSGAGKPAAPQGWRQHSGRNGGRNGHVRPLPAESRSHDGGASSGFISC